MFSDAGRTGLPFGILDSSCSKNIDGESFKAHEFPWKSSSDSYSWRDFGHSLFLLGQFCDSDLEVAFRKHTCFVRDNKGTDILKGSRGTNLYTISIDELMKSSPICLHVKVPRSKSWLWHPVNLKSKKFSHRPKSENTNMEVLHTLHMDLCGPMRVQSIKGKKYILVIVDDYSRLYMGCWALFYQKSVSRTPQQNGVVERRNRTLVEAARTMMIFEKAPIDKSRKISSQCDIGICRWVMLPIAGRAIESINRELVSIGWKQFHVTFDEMHQSMAPGSTTKSIDNENFKRLDPCLLLKLLETQFRCSSSPILFGLMNIVGHGHATNSYNTLDSIFQNSVKLIQQWIFKKLISDKKWMIKMEYDKQGDRIKRAGTCCRSGKMKHVDDADIRPIYDEEPMAEVQMTADDNVSATGQQHTEQPEFINEGEVDQNAEQCHDTCPCMHTLTRMSSYIRKRALETDSTKSFLDSIKRVTNSRKKGFAIAAFKNELRKLTGSSVNTNLKDLEFLKPRFASQVVVKQRLVQKPSHYTSFAKRRESALQNLITDCTKLHLGTSFNPTEEGLRVWFTKKKDILRKTGFTEILDLMITKMTFEHSLVPQDKRRQIYDNYEPLPQDKNVCSSPGEDDCHTRNTVVHHFNHKSHDFRGPEINPFLETSSWKSSMPVQTMHDRLPQILKMCMVALKVSIVEPKNIKEAMADSASD
ncbi:integrase, catalytic region, zinc finger, CCHC-type containing protein [Tanacetum coccineum]